MKYFMEMTIVTKRNRRPICIRCEFGYPIELDIDMANQKYVCPLCGYTISFKDWMFGE
jgi:DNA-directed RNA polymerase subunit RPC12/RpoP